MELQCCVGAASSKICITDADVSYQYSSDTGLLFVFVERVKLDGEAGQRVPSCILGHFLSPTRSPSSKGDTLIAEEKCVDNQSSRANFTGALRRGLSRIWRYGNKSNDHK
jgi:hypothetical protein